MIKTSVQKISFLLVFICSINSSGQEIIDYAHKAIDKEIEKKLALDNYQLVGIGDTDSDTSQGKYFAITDSVSHKGYVYVGRVNSCRAGGCSLASDENVQLSFEYFDYFVLYNTNVQIQSVRIFNYQATQGQEVCSRSWLKQFNGYGADSKLKVGRDIDGISGATISVYSLTFDIEKVSYLLKEKLAGTKPKVANIHSEAREEDAISLTPKKEVRLIRYSL